jgi:hypothetical protein
MVNYSINLSKTLNFIDMLKLAKDGYTDIIIYVIITVVVLITNAYKSFSKRKDSEKRTGMPSPSEKPIFPDVLFEPVFEQNESEPEPEVYAEKEAEILDKPLSDLDQPVTENIPTISLQEGEAAFEETSYYMSPEHLISESVIESEDLTLVKFFEENKIVEKAKFEFDVSKAVIYSEILKPKYF